MENIKHDISNGQQLSEEGIKKILINKYERNPLARRICIEYHGSLCKICGFDFNKAYGEIGKGFIHVHHIKPISEINQKYILDPIHDLIPICPNCHAMIHRGKTAISIDTLKLAMNNLQ